MRKISFIVQISIELTSIKFLWLLQTTAEMDMIKVCTGGLCSLMIRKKENRSLCIDDVLLTVSLTDAGLCFLKEHNLVVQDYTYIY